ncbi:MAG: ABC transporter substrate-binding protein [Spirochaetaceae bacterium]
MKRAAVPPVVLLVFAAVATAVPAQEAGPRHARGFTMEQMAEATLLTVDGGERDARYLLVPRGASVPEVDGDPTVIRTPVRSLVTLSSTYLPALRALGVTDRVVGHDRRSWVYSSSIREAMEDGRIAEVGSGGNLNTERLLALEPDIVLTYDAGTAAENPYPGLADLDLTVVTTTEFRESSPLGRSEWILFLGALFDREAEARRIFADIEDRYNTLRRLAADVDERPTVFLNAPWGSSWSMPEGDNYSAEFLADAGADYVFSDRSGRGTLFLDFETVLDTAGTAQYWLNPGQWESLDDGLEADGRFRLFEAFRDGRVYNNDARVAPSGGNDYFESGYLRADLVLADLIAIFHPEILPDHELYYYRRLH